MQTTTTYNAKAQAVITKGIASQLLKMNVPTFEEAHKLFEQFGVALVSHDEQEKDVDSISNLVNIADGQVRKIQELEEKVAGMYSGEFVQTLLIAMMMKMDTNTQCSIPGKTLGDKSVIILDVAMHLHNEHRLRADNLNWNLAVYSDK